MNGPLMEIPRCGEGVVVQALPSVEELVNGSGLNFLFPSRSDCCEIMRWAVSLGVVSRVESIRDRDRDRDCRLRGCLFSDFWAQLVTIPPELGFRPHKDGPGPSALDLSL